MALCQTVQREELMEIQRRLIDCQHEVTVPHTNNCEFADFAGYMPSNTCKMHRCAFLVSHVVLVVQNGALKKRNGELQATIFELNKWKSVRHPVLKLMSVCMLDYAVVLVIWFGCVISTTLAAQMDGPLALAPASELTNVAHEPNALP